MTRSSGTPDDSPENTAEEEAIDRSAGEVAHASKTQGGRSAVLKGEPGFREPPEDFAAAAQVAPRHWLSVIDRHWEGEEGEPPPPWVILGRWRSEEHGEIVEWEENTEYRPSPDAYGWAGPVSPADAAVRLVATGYGSQELFALVLADAEVAVCIDDDGEPTVTEAPDGSSACAPPDFDVPPSGRSVMPPPCPSLTGVAGTVLHLAIRRHSRLGRPHGWVSPA
ncbi:type VII secretion system-associated protein [Streptomyces cucumeris]|uniref:type VII secretion system-associated protein n=1 Tax=Streptomyces cucumeris TaxID=2962890 RepID=UPI003EB71246